MSSFIQFIPTPPSTSLSRLIDLCSVRRSADRRSRHGRATVVRFLFSLAKHVQAAPRNREPRQRHSSCARMTEARVRAKPCAPNRRKIARKKNARPARKICATRAHGEREIGAFFTRERSPRAHYYYLHQHHQPPSPSSPLPPPPARASREGLFICAMTRVVYPVSHCGGGGGSRRR